MNRLSGAALSKAFARVFDMTCSAAGLLLLLPVFAEAAMAIILDDGLPDLFQSDESWKKRNAFSDMEI